MAWFSLLAPVAAEFAYYLPGICVDVLKSLFYVDEVSCVGDLSALFVAAMGGFAPCCSILLFSVVLFYCFEESTVSWLVREVDDAVMRVDFLASLAGGGDCF